MLTEAEISHEEMSRLTGSHVCLQCGARLSVCWGGNYGVNEYALRCTRDINHTGVMRKYIPTAYEIAQGVKEMENTKITEYANRTSLTREQASEILATFWPNASPEARLKGAMICSMYGLNPILNHVALMKFKDTWVVALEIKATRILARRSGSYSYLDMTPRAMTQDEQVKVFGEELTDRYCSITHVKDDAGHEAYGYGVWLKADKPYGTDKGNTAQNMANIRSERQALDRLFPDTMPQNIDVFDAEYSEVKDDNTQLAETLWNTEEAQPPVNHEEFKNVGELFDYCYKKYDLIATRVMKELNVEEPGEIKNFVLAKQTIDNVYGTS